MVSFMSKMCKEAFLTKNSRIIVQNFTTETRNLDQTVKPVWAKFQGEQKRVPGKIQELTKDIIGKSSFCYLTPAGN